MSYLVATPQGYRRKIGPRSRYGSTPDESAYQRTPTMADRVNRDTQMTGTAHRSRNPHAERESMEVMQREKADRYLFDQEKRKANQARKREEAQRNEAATSKASASTASTVAAGMVGGPMAAKLAGGISSFLAKQRTGMDRAERVKQAAADRAKGRAKYEAEKSGKAPEPAMVEKKPEQRKEAVMPAATHSTPTKSAATPAPKSAAKTAQASTKAPTNGFSSEFHRRFDPMPSATTPYSKMSDRELKDAYKELGASPRSGIGILREQLRRKAIQQSNGI